MPDMAILPLDYNSTGFRRDAILSSDEGELQLSSSTFSGIFRKIRLY